MNKQKLKEQEQEIERKIKEFDKQGEKIEKEIKNSEEYKKLYNEEKKLKKEQDILGDKISEIKQDIRLKYLDEDTSYPIYKGTENNRRNILPETINAIKRVLGIKNISLLNNGEIVEAVKKLIDNSLRQNKELTNLEEKYDEIDDKINKIDDEKDDLLDYDKDGKIWDERQALYTELDNIKEMRNGDGEKGKKKFEIYNKKVEARNKLKKFGENLDKIDTAITKEMIINNLEEEDEE